MTSESVPSNDTAAARSGDGVPRRIGVLLVGVDEKRTTPGIQYLLLHLNRLQKTYELEFLPNATENFFVALAPYLTINRAETRKELAALLPPYEERLRAYIAEDSIVRKNLSDHYVFVSLASFDEDYYAARDDRFSVIALGKWKQYLSPPTQAEFLLALMVREALYALCPTFRNPIHLGTAGCVADFSFDIRDTRQKVLGAFVCHYCRAEMRRAGFQGVADEVEYVLSKKWFGRKGDPSSPASISAKLGHHLFLTNKLEPGFLARMMSSLRQEGLKQVGKVVGILLGAALVFGSGWLANKHGDTLLGRFLKQAEKGLDK